MKAPIPIRIVAASVPNPQWIADDLARATMTRTETSSVFSSGKTKSGSDNFPYRSVSIPNEELSAVLESLSVEVLKRESVADNFRLLVVIVSGHTLDPLGRRRIKCHRPPIPLLFGLLSAFIIFVHGIILAPK
jgi:hypothetical protein